MGTAGFRNVLGVSGATGGSAFEVFTFEIPFTDFIGSWTPGSSNTNR